MKNNRLKICCFLLLMSHSALTWSLPKVILNINGYSINNGELVNFTAMAFEDGKVIKIGTTQELRSLFSDAELIDGEGQFLLPGFHDSMVNMMQSALIDTQVDLRDAQSLEQIQKKIKEFASQNPDEPWIQGHGWDHNNWDNPVLPTHKDLDAINLNKPIWLKSKNNKMGWTNTKAMEMTKAAKYKTNPSGGQIIFNEDQSHSGVYIDYALNIIAPHIPDIKPNIKYNNIKNNLNELASLGITSIYDSGIDYRTMAIYISLSKNDELPVRVNASIASSEKKLPIIMRKEAFHQESQFLHIHGIKYYVDGELDTHSAALLQPYNDMPENKGRIKQSQAYLQDNIFQYSANGWQSTIHAMGDMANNIGLGIAINDLAKNNDLRHRIEKNVLVSDKDWSRLESNKIIYAIQPFAAIKNFHLDQKKLGRKRLKRSHQWQRLIKTGATIIIGSGFPQYSANPFLGLHAAVTRRSHENDDKLFRRKTQNLSTEQALAAYTINAAFANRQEMTMGSLSPEKWADFIIVDKDIINSDANELWQTKVLQTWVAGNKVYDRKNTTN